MAQTKYPRSFTLMISLLQNMFRYNYAKYSMFLKVDRQKIAEEFLAHFNTELLDLYEKGNLMDSRRLRKLQEKPTWSGHGIYIHVLLIKSDIRFYVGQASNLQNRVVSQHCTSAYRKVNSSLHYSAWQLCSDEFFITASQCDLSGLDKFIAQQKLNVFEMFFALMVRSLPPTTLTKYLPSSEESDQGLGLNVASPLAQGDKDACQAALKDLRNSTDPIIANYYQTHEIGSEKFRALTRERATTRLLQGSWRKITEKRGGRTMIIHHVHVYVPMDFPLDPRAVAVFVRAELVEIGMEHPCPLAQECELDDPARRLGLKFLGFTSGGSPISTWVVNKGKEAAFSINTLVDWLDGVPLEETLKLPRRKVSKEYRENLVKVQQKKEKRNARKSSIKTRSLGSGPSIPCAVKGIGAREFEAADIQTNIRGLTTSHSKQIADIGEHEIKLLGADSSTLYSLKVSQAALRNLENTQLKKAKQNAQRLSSETCSDSNSSFHHAIKKIRSTEFETVNIATNPPSQILISTLDNQVIEIGEQELELSGADLSTVYSFEVFRNYYRKPEPEIYEADKSKSQFTG